MDISATADILGIVAFAWVTGREICVRVVAVYAGWTPEAKVISAIGFIMVGLAMLPVVGTMQLWYPALLQHFA